MAVSESGLDFIIATLAPYLSHREGCAETPCSCGLIEAIEETNGRIENAN